MGDQALQFPVFGRSQFPVFADGQIAQFDIHDANTDQFGHLIPEDFAHPSDLSVEALRKDDAESGFAQLLDHAFFSDSSEDGNAIAHPGNEVSPDGLIDSDDIFLFVLVASPEDLVDDVAIVGEEDEPLGRLVQSADREEALFVPDIGDDIFRLFGISGTDNTHRLVECDIKGLRFCLEGFAIDTNDVPGRNTVAGSGRLTIQGYSATFDQAISFATRADAGLADVLVEADGVVVGRFQTKDGCVWSERPKSRGLSGLDWISTYSSEASSSVDQGSFRPSLNNLVLIPGNQNGWESYYSTENRKG